MVELPFYYDVDMRITALDYELPPGHIAVQPAQPRDSARLMVVRRGSNQVSHHRVSDIPDLGLLHAGDLLVFNRSKVIPACFRGQRAKTHGQVEGLYLHTPDPNQPRRCVVMLQARGTLQPHERIVLEDQTQLELLERQDQGQWLGEMHGPEAILTLLERVGLPPIPPYIRKERKAQDLPEFVVEDRLRYNTVYARDPGSVAAPTAGLHFTPELLAHLWSRGVHCAWVTLHVGMGTFAPIRAEKLADHPMHAEWLNVPAETIQALRETRDRGYRIVPVGTTSVRALESLPPAWEACAQGYAGWTRLFIQPTADPPFVFRFTDQLLTNFHLPRSTLLAMVASLPDVGIDRLHLWYQEAIKHHYRFYSFGDAMWLA